VPLARRRRRKKEIGEALSKRQKENDKVCSVLFGFSSLVAGKRWRRSVARASSREPETQATCVAGRENRYT